MARRDGVVDTGSAVRLLDQRLPSGRQYKALAVAFGQLGCAFADYSGILRAQRGQRIGLVVGPETAAAGGNGCGRRIAQRTRLQAVQQLGPCDVLQPVTHIVGRHLQALAHEGRQTGPQIGFFLLIVIVVVEAGPLGTSLALEAMGHLFHGIGSFFGQGRPGGFCGAMAVCVVVMRVLVCVCMPMVVWMILRVLMMLMPLAMSVMFMPVTVCMLASMVMRM